MKALDQSPPSEPLAALWSFLVTLKAQDDSHPDGTGHLVIAVDRSSGALRVRTPTSDAGAPGFDELQLCATTTEGATVLASGIARYATSDTEEVSPADGHAPTVRKAIETLPLPYARTRLIDIELAQEGCAFYVYLLLADGDRPGAAQPRTRYRFRLAQHSCHRLDEASATPQALSVDRFLAPDTRVETPGVTQHSGGVLPWPVSTLLLMAAAALVGWICATAGSSTEGAGATVATTMYLLGTLPFFSRRLGGYTLAGLLNVSAVGVLVSLCAFLIKANMVVIPVLVIGALLPTAFRANAYGRTMQALVDLEKGQPTASKFMATRTEQEQNLLGIADYFVVLFLFCVLAYAHSVLKAWAN